MLKKFKVSNKKHNYEIDFTKQCDYPFNNNFFVDDINKITMLYRGDIFGKTTFINYLFNISKNIFHSNIESEKPSNNYDYTTYEYTFIINDSNYYYYYVKDNSTGYIFEESLDRNGELLINSVEDGRSLLCKIKDSEIELYNFISQMRLYRVSEIFNFKSKLYHSAWHHYAQFRRFCKKQLRINIAKDLNEFKIGSSNTLFEWFILYITQQEECSFVIIDEVNSIPRKHIKTYLSTLTSKQALISSTNSEYICNDILRPDLYYIMTYEGLRSFKDIYGPKELRESHNLRKMYLTTY